MTGRKKEQVLVLVRATPEKSRKYGYTVCVAGLNQYGELRRLYPFRFNYGDKLIDFKKKDIIEVEITNSDNDQRKESRKALNPRNLSSTLSNDEVRKRITPLVTSIENLKADDASLGIIKPELEDIEIKINSTEIYDNQAYFNLSGDYLTGKEEVKMPVEVRYLFKCKDNPNCSGHKLIIIDWELNELTRNIMKTDKDQSSIKTKIYERMFNFMKTRDLYLILGTHFRFKTWMIIGIFYPALLKEDKAQKSLFDF